MLDGPSTRAVAGNSMLNARGSQEAVRQPFPMLTRTLCAVGSVYGTIHECVCVCAVAT